MGREQHRATARPANDGQWRGGADHAFQQTLSGSGRFLAPSLENGSIHDHHRRSSSKPNAAFARLEAACFVQRRNGGRLLDQFLFLVEQRSRSNSHRPWVVCWRSNCQRAAPAGCDANRNGLPCDDGGAGPAGLGAGRSLALSPAPPLIITDLRLHPRSSISSVTEQSAIHL